MASIEDPKGTCDNKGCVMRHLEADGEKISDLAKTYSNQCVNITDGNCPVVQGYEKDQRSQSDPALEVSSWT